jgi:NAD(P)-dependent dehydrogenase (short-subunit alcohol dehydrogenase family)
MNAQKPVAIVTGASSGIGLALTKALLERDYRVVGTSRTATKSKELKAGENLVLVDGDAGRKDTAVKVTNAAIDKFGRIDMLVNNAGIFMSKPFTDYTEEDFALMISTNVASFFYMTQQVVPHMTKQKDGHVVSISTTLTDQPLAGVPAALPVITKTALNGVAKELAIEYATSNIRFNVVSPGTIDTPMHANGDHEALKKLSPLHRLGTTDDIIQAILFLDSAKFITGENVRVDGGAHAGKW